MLLRDRQRRWNQRRTGMGAAAGLGEIVKLEGVSESTIGERRRRRAHGFATRSENETVAGGAVRPGIRDDHLAPGQVGATDDGADSIGDAVLGALDHHWRQILIPYRDCVLGKMARRPVHSLPRWAVTVGLLAADAFEITSAPRSDNIMPPLAPAWKLASSRRNG